MQKRLTDWCTVSSSNFASSQTSTNLSAEPFRIQTSTELFAESFRGEDFFSTCKAEIYRQLARIIIRWCFKWQTHTFTPRWVVGKSNISELQTFASGALILKFQQPQQQAAEATAAAAAAAASAAKTAAVAGFPGIRNATFCKEGISKSHGICDDFGFHSWESLSF
jgi:hypothetical protein